MLRVDKFFKNTPEAQTRAGQPAKTTPSGAVVTNYRLASVVTVPVVVHIVLPNPYLVSDADIQIQIDRLNLDYSGFNADSNNAPSAFLAVRGHSQIQFTLAKQTPAGQVTSGIERRAGGTGSDATLAVDPIKHTSMGGLDLWDPNAYLNLWIGQDASGQGILGYAQFPGTTPADEDGVFLNLQSFGVNTCYTMPQFNLGRTASHEIGHYFGLFHIWGDEEECSGDDFENLTTVGSSFVLPAGLFNPSGQGNTALDIGDTPNQAGATTNCPAGITTDACATSGAGKMYQNQMDFSFDNCLTMFTAKQVQRMEYVLDNSRSGLKTSVGGQAPAFAIGLDAAPLESVNPGGFEVSGCTPVSYSAMLSCAGNIAPKFRFRNNGLNPITTITTGYRLNNGMAVTQNITLNLASGSAAIVTFPSIFLAVGNYQFKFFTSNPNGSTDMVAANDTLVQGLIVSGAATIPITEDFETSAFPPGNWTVINPDGDFTWQRATQGKASNGAMYIENFSADGTDHIDDLKSQSIATTGLASVTLTFDLAHKNYGSTGQFWDTLSILVSNDCGVTFKNVYKKWGPSLATAGSSSNAYLSPEETDWRKESINLSGSILSTGQILIVFRNTSRFGNSIFIDNINIALPAPRDLKLSAILSPAPFTCSNSVSPQAAVTNESGEIVTSFNVGYRIDNGTNIIQTFTQAINPGETINVSLGNVATSTGNKTITVFTSGPVSVSGTGDSNGSNDTLTKVFSIPGTARTPFKESFETSSFAPANWSLLNPDGSITWSRNANGNGNAGSAFINTFNYAASGQSDLLAMPIISYSGVDSVKLSFDLGASPYRSSGNLMDTLEVLVTTDCGNTFTSVYKKWGTPLKTTSTTQSTEFFPVVSNEWRKETIDLTPFLNRSPILVLFRAANTGENNIFIDNVNLTTRTLPSLVKQQGYLILPNTFRTGFTVWQYAQSASLKYINVFNTAGQLVWSKQFNGNASQYNFIDLSSNPSGMFIVKLGYTDESKNVTKRVIKY